MGLVLDRRRGQAIVISFGDKSVTMTVGSMDARGSIRLHFEGPQDIVVVRSEIAQDFLEKRGHTYKETDDEDSTESQREVPSYGRREKGGASRNPGA